MTFVKSREDFLFNLLGIKLFHCIGNTAYTSKGLYDEAQYFYKLWDYAVQQKWWPKFKEDMIGSEGDGTYGPLFWGVQEKYVDAERFAAALYLFLNPKEDNEHNSKTHGEG